MTELFKDIATKMVKGKRMKLIKFDPDYYKEGINAIIRLGFVGFTDERGVFYVPEGTLKKLDSKNIPYHITHKKIDA